MHTPISYSAIAATNKISNFLICFPVLLELAVSKRVLAAADNRPPSLPFAVVLFVTDSKNPWQASPKFLCSFQVFILCPLEVY